MMLPLTFLLGAGASYQYGIPMMIGFYQEFRRHIEQKHLASFALLQQFESTGLHQKPDLETLLSDLETVLKTGEGFRLIGGTSDELANKLQVARELRGYLDAFIVDTCERFDREIVVHDYATVVLLSRLAPLYVFSTNYDRAIEFTCERLGLSYADGFESTRQPVANWTGEFDAAVRVVKLHGSVNWYVDEPGRALHRLDRGYSLPAYDFRIIRGDQVLRPLMIIPTLEKEALGDPYVELAMRFTDVLKETKVLIVAGNSLRDRHIRAYIRGRISSLHVLLVGPNASINRAVFDREERTHSLDAGFAEFLTVGKSALQKLAQTLLDSAPLDDVAVGEAVERFISDASRTIQNAADLSTNPELAILWRESKEGGPATRANSVLELGKHPHPAVVRHVVEVIQNDHEPAVRVAAVSTLAKLDPAEAIQVFGSLVVNDPSQLVQMEAALALIEIKEERGAIPSLESATKENLGASLRIIIEEGLRSVKESKSPG